MDQKTATALVASALTNTTVAKLYAAVDALSPITIEPSDKKTWGSTTDAFGTTVSAAMTNYPAESLYHELLHADLKLSGYRQHVTYVRVSDDPLPEFMANALDNELQHHRIFPSFAAAGFNPEHFYNDDDDRTYARVRTELKRADPAKTNSATYFLHYLSVIAPGGKGGEDKRSQLDRFFRMRVPADKMARVTAAADKVRAWGSSTENDPGGLTADIIAGLGDFDGWWIGASEQFPTDGHFTGEPFSIADASRFIAGRSGKH